MKALKAFCLIFVGGMLGGAFVECAFDAGACYGEWHDSPYKVSWSPLRSCRLSKDGITWVDSFEWWRFGETK